VPEFSLPPVADPLRSGGLADSVYEKAVSDPDLAQLAIRRGPGDGDWHEVTTAAFRDHVLSLARGLLADGLQFGDRVAVMTGARYEWTLFAYALWSIGAQIVPLYPSSSPGQLRWVLSTSRACAIVVENEEDAMTLGSICGDLVGMRRIWQLDAGCVRQLTLVGRAVPDALVHQHRCTVTPRSTAAVVYTSGTTGRPRGCVLTHSNLAAQCDTIIAGWGGLMARPGEQPSLLGFLPVGHVYGLMVTVLCLRGGILLGHQRDLGARELLPALASFRPTCVFAVPYVYEQLYAGARMAAGEEGREEHFDQAMELAVRYAELAEARSLGRGPGPGPGMRARHARYDRQVYRKMRSALGGRVRNVVSGGSTISRELSLMLRGCGITVYSCYGLTETAGAITAQPPGRSRTGTVGRPLPGSAVRIADDDEVWVRGASVFARYEADPRATETALRGRWLATGDMGRLEDGYLTITGRKKDIITTSAGGSVAPLPLEARLRAHPLIAQALIVGENRPYVSALITLDPEAMEHWRRGRGQVRGSARDQGHPQGRGRGEGPVERLGGGRSGRERGKEGPEGRREKESPEGRRGHKGPDGRRGDSLAEELEREIGRAVAAINSAVSRTESIRAFRILAEGFTVDNGLLTPSLKPRRDAITRTYAAEISELYARQAGLG
jgi:long-chain acyl-CoA synthetase